MVSSRSIAMRTITPVLSSSRSSAGPRKIPLGWNARSMVTIRSKSVGTGPRSRARASCQTLNNSKFRIWVRSCLTILRKKVTNPAIDSWLWGMPAGRCCLFYEGEGGMHVDVPVCRLCPAIRFQSASHQDLSDLLPHSCSDHLTIHVGLSSTGGSNSTYGRSRGPSLGQPHDNR